MAFPDPVQDLDLLTLLKKTFDFFRRGVVIVSGLDIQIPADQVGRKGNTDRNTDANPAAGNGGRS